MTQPGLPGLEFAERRYFGRHPKTDEERRQRARAARRRSRTARYEEMRDYRKTKYRENRAQVLARAAAQYRKRRADLGKIVKTPYGAKLSEQERQKRRALAHARWAAANRERINARVRERRRSNPQARKAAYERRRQKPAENLSSAMRSAIRRAFTVKKLRTDKNARSWEALAGYTAQELRAHLEKQFQPRMSWKNFGKWHVDHIVPASSFNFTSVDDPEFRACWALSNLRPIWGKQNREKAARREHLL